LQWEHELVMSRFARTVDTSRKNEIIFFYFENLKSYTDKSVSDFDASANHAKQQKILESVDANSRVAFKVSQ